MTILDRPGSGRGRASIVAGGTRVRLRNEGDASRAYRFAAPLLGVAVGRATQRDVDRLKRILESRPT